MSAALNRRDSAVLLCLGASLALLIGVPAILGWFAPAERPLYDLQLRWTHPPSPENIMLVCIDDVSSAELGGRPPNRTEVAQVLQTLWDRGAGLIGLDQILLRPKAEHDDALESALSRVDTVLAVSPERDQWPLERFQAQAVGLGSVDVITDPDGILRALPQPYVEPTPQGFRIDALPFSMALAMAFWYPEDLPELALRDGSFHIGEHAIPIQGGQWLLPYCGGAGTLPQISFCDVLHRPDSLPEIRDRIVLIGSTRAVDHDAFSVPLPSREVRDQDFEAIGSHVMSGVEIHGHALGALLSGTLFRNLSAGTRTGLLIAVCLLAWLLAALPLRPLVSLSVWGGGGLLIIAGSLTALSKGWVLPLFSVGLLWLSFAAASFAFHRYRDFRERRAVERLFGRYVSPNVAEILLKNPDLVQAGGRRKVLTILFSDIRGFTSLSERIPPERVTELLNEYFTQVTKIIFRYDGTLDKFIGDAVLAFFGDPLDQENHPALAVECAVAMQEEAARLRERFEAEGKPPLHVGVSVHTGPAVVGNHGSRDNWLYTVIGDTVNLTSRLEGLAVRDDVILTRSTVDLILGLRERFIVEDLDPVKVKGKSEPIEICRITGRKAISEPAEGPDSKEVNA